VIVIIYIYIYNTLYSMRRVLLLCIVLLLCFLSLSNCSELEDQIERRSAANPKLVAKTVYNYKFVKNEDGVLEKVKIPRKALFQVVNRKTVVPDPLDPSKEITINVPTQIEYNPDAKSHKKLNKLKKRLHALQRREKQLKAAYVQANSKKVDLPVLEDGAPAPPDRQQIKMAQELYDEIAATQLPKAKTIKQADLENARSMITAVGAQREATWNLFDDMKEKMLVPSHGWSMEM